MTLKSFFNKRDTFTAASNAVAKIRFFNANGATHTSLGHRPRNRILTNSQALKGRFMISRTDLAREWSALSGLNSYLNITPRAMPWASMKRPVRAEETTA